MPESCRQTLSVDTSRCRRRCLDKRLHNTRFHPCRGNHRVGTSPCRRCLRGKQQRNTARWWYNPNHPANTLADRRSCRCIRRCNIGRRRCTFRCLRRKSRGHRRHRHTNCCSSPHRACRSRPRHCMNRRGIPRPRKPIQHNTGHRSRRTCLPSSIQDRRPVLPLHRFHPIQSNPGVRHRQSNRGCPGRTKEKRPDKRVVACLQRNMKVHMLVQFPEIRLWLAPLFHHCRHG